MAFDNIEVELLRAQIIRDSAVNAVTRLGEGLREQSASSVGMDYVPSNGEYDDNDNFVSAWMAGDIVASAPS